MAPFRQLKHLINLKVIFLSGILLTPLLPSFGSWGYEQVKVIAVIFLTNFLGLIWLKDKPKLILTSIQKLGLIFILILLLSSLLGLRSSESLFGAEPYYQGWLTYLYLFLFSWIISNLRVSFKFQSLVWVVGGVGVAILAIYQYFLLNFLNQFVPTYAGRVVSSFGQPNFYSGFLLLLIPLQIFLFKQKNWRFFIIVSLVVNLSAIIISQSRISMALAGLIILNWGAVSIKSRTLKVYLVILGILILGFLAVRVVTDEVLVLPKPNAINFTPERRVYIWQILPEIVLKQPVSGYGLENISLAYQNYFQNLNFNINQDPVKLSLKDVVIDRTHNYLLDLLIFSGGLGLLSYLALAGIILKKSFKTPLFLPLLLYLVWVSFQNQSIIQLIYFWWLVGIMDNQTA